MKKELNFKFELGEEVKFKTEKYQRYIILQRKHYEDIDGGQGNIYNLAGSTGFATDIFEYLLEKSMV